MNLDESAETGRRNDLELIRRGQRSLNGGLLAAICGGLLLWATDSWFVLLAFTFAGFVLAVRGAVQLAAGFRWSRLATVLSAGIIAVPGLNLLALAYLDRRATRALRPYGFRVGLLGARARYLPPPLPIEWPEAGAQQVS
jgi:hypothetical protein